jgi:hypothetical protein
MATVSFAFFDAIKPKKKGNDLLPSPFSLQQNQRKRRWQQLLLPSTL